MEFWIYSVVIYRVGDNGVENSVTNRGMEFTFSEPVLPEYIKELKIFQGNNISNPGKFPDI